MTGRLSLATLMTAIAPERAVSGDDEAEDPPETPQQRLDALHGHRAANVTPLSLQAASKLLCTRTLSSFDAAVVTRRRRRVTFFAFPSGGAPTGASRHLRLALCDDRGPAPKTQTSPTAQTARTAAHLRAGRRPR